MTVQFPPTHLREGPEPGKAAWTVGPVLSLDQTQVFAQYLARILKAGDLLAVRGSMGAGKTTLIRMVSRELGAESEAVSPTFALQRVMELNPPTHSSPTHMVHYDLYRIDDPRELTELGFGQEDEDALVVVEWPERAPGLFEKAVFSLDITQDSAGNRMFQLVGPATRLHLVSVQS